MESNLTELKINGEERLCLFTTVGGVAQALKDIFTQIDVLVEKDPQLRTYIVPLDDRFVWRVIEGEKRLSPHSYGIAIDLNPTKGIYWRHVKDKEIYLQTQKHYPSEVISLFEQRGFVWGGKWYEYDFMHFEYQPELICKAQRCSL